MTYKQRQNGKSYLRRYHRIHVLDNTEQHLDENQKARPIHSAHRRALSFVKQCQHEKAVDGYEAAIVNDKEWNEKQLAKMCDRVGHPGEHHLQDIIEPDDQVLRPVQKNNVKSIPAEKQDTEQQYCVRR